jgi:hypothetical protein
MEVNIENFKMQKKRLGFKMRNKLTTQYVLFIYQCDTKSFLALSKEKCFFLIWSDRRDMLKPIKQLTMNLLKLAHAKCCLIAYETI